MNIRREMLSFSNYWILGWIYSSTTCWTVEWVVLHATKGAWGLSNVSMDPRLGGGEVTEVNWVEPIHFWNIILQIGFLLMLLILTILLIILQLICTVFVFRKGIRPGHKLSDLADPDRAKLTICCEVYRIESWINWLLQQFHFTF